MPLNNPTSVDEFPIVGVHFHPPASALVNAIPPCTTLWLRAEPSNQYDPNAIGVWIKPSEIPLSAYDHLNEELEKSGTNMEDLLEIDEIMLGYIPRGLAKFLKESGRIGGNDPDTEGEFGINFAGKPLVRIEAE